VYVRTSKAPYPQSCRFYKARRSPCDARPYCPRLGVGIGVVGYHYLGELDWLDALLNASMILGGMDCGSSA